MFRICIRKITRAALPHPWFDIEHPMLKADPELMKIVKVLEKRGVKKKEVDRDMSLEEHNTEDVNLFDVPHDVYEQEQELVQTLTKVYSNYNPNKILESAASLPGFNFDSKVQELEKFDSNYTYQEMNDAKVIDYRYVVSRFAPPKFKKLVDIYLSKVPIFGFVVPLEQSQMAMELNSAFDKEFHSFLFGDGAFLDEEERHVFRRFLIRQINSNIYLDDRDIPFINEAEDNFMLGMINWPGTDDHEYRCFYRPYFREYDINKEMWTRNKNKLLITLSRYIWFWNYNRNPRNYAQSVAYTLVDRIKRYFISREFNYGKLHLAFDLPGSFVSRTNLMFIHVWIICERLRVIAYDLNVELSKFSIKDRILDSSVRTEARLIKRDLKLISYLNEKIMKLSDNQLEKALYLLKIHPAHRNKIKTICQKQIENVTYLLYKHFEIDNKGYKDLDVLMQSIFFPQKQNLQEFPDFVFSIGDYLMKHREHLSTLSLDDIKFANIDWDVMRIDRSVVKLMKTAREGEEVKEFPKHTLDEHDMRIIESLESVLPEERRAKAEPQVKVNPLKEKYKPINKI